MHPVTTNIQASFLMNGTAQGFHHEVNGDFRRVMVFYGCDIQKLNVDQQHCSYSLTLNKITK
jgi:hypothetical protein